MDTLFLLVACSLLGKRRSRNSSERSRTAFCLLVISFFVIFVDHRRARARERIEIAETVVLKERVAVLHRRVMRSVPFERTCPLVNTRRQPSFSGNGCFCESNDPRSIASPFASTNRISYDSRSDPWSDETNRAANGSVHCSVVPPTPHQIAPRSSISRGADTSMLSVMRSSIQRSLLHRPSDARRLSRSRETALHIQRRRSSVISSSR